MRKLLSFLFLLVIGTSAFAQKKYLTVYTDFSVYGIESEVFAWMSGDVPEGMSSRVKYNDVASANRDTYSKDIIGGLLNMLSEKGYALESTTALPNASGNSKVLFLFSRGAADPGSGIQRIAADKDGDVTEIARYNLQGIPVSESDRGIQIIVYSNYTTKTVIKE